MRFQGFFAETLRRWGKDRRGAAAIEFAFVAPVLLVLYMMTMEVSQAIDTNKKVSRIASLTADLVTQEQDIIKSEIDAIMTLSEAVVAPYNRSKPTVEIDAISIDATSKATIAWSRKYVNGVASDHIAKGTIVTGIPAKLILPSTFLIRSHGKLTYTPLVSWMATSTPGSWTTSTTSIEMDEVYFLRPRIASTVTCADC
ncbi:MAG: pilus assembly protein [Phyllobacteriaceae bacterium]|nr:pilus assembly protein [Phyllobacteriaceae bacterium]